MATTFKTQQRRAHQKLWNTLDDHLLPFASKGVVLAVSGGPDSRALLEAVASWSKRRHGQFIVATIDHGVRKESAVEARLVALRAKRLGFDTFTMRLETSSTSEHILRDLRYRELFFLAQSKGFTCIATAHQRDDNSEGYLMALLGFGGGELGAAMRETQTIKGVTLCRPFLSLTKGELLASLTMEQQTDFVRDSCDEGRKGKRALIRHDVMPHLLSFAPTLSSRLNNFGTAQAQQTAILEKLADALIVWRDDNAVVPLAPKPEPALLVSALWQIVKRFGDGKDLRSAGSQISAIAEDVFLDDFAKNRGKPGLDPRLNGFNLMPLNVKQYQVPGAVVFRAKHEIHVRRV